MTEIFLWPDVAFHDRSVSSSGVVLDISGDATRYADGSSHNVGATGCPVHPTLNPTEKGATRDTRRGAPRPPPWCSCAIEISYVQHAFTSDSRAPFPGPLRVATWAYVARGGGVGEGGRRRRRADAVPLAGEVGAPSRPTAARRVRARRPTRARAASCQAWAAAAGRQRGASDGGLERERGRTLPRVRPRLRECGAERPTRSPAVLHPSNSRIAPVRATNSDRSRVTTFFGLQMHCCMPAGHSRGTHGASPCPFSRSVRYALTWLPFVAPTGDHRWATCGVRPAGYVHALARAFAPVVMVRVGAPG